MPLGRQPARWSSRCSRFPALLSFSSQSESRGLPPHARAPFGVLALMMFGGAIVGLLIWNAFPMHMRGAERTLTDRMHLILAANPFILLAICAAAVAFPGRFRLYSIVTLVLLFVPAIFAFRLAPLVDANAPTPWLGISERFAQYQTGVWQVVLAMVLLRRQRRYP